MLTTIRVNAKLYFSTKAKAEAEASYLRASGLSVSVPAEVAGEDGQPEGCPWMIRRTR